MDAPETRTRLEPVPLADVTVEGRFWEPILRVNREATIPHVYGECEASGRIGAFRLDWQPGVEPRPHYFWDSDVAKWVEAASYRLATHPEPALDALLDRVVGLIASAQQPDGYLNTYFTVVEPEMRWRDLRDAHELYCAGHLIEAGVAHHAATGKRVLLDAVCRLADHVQRVFGREPGQRRGYPGHEEIELALVRLWEATGEGRYLALARYFVEERGQMPHYFDLEAEAREGPGHAEDFMHGMRDRHRYNQSHQPVREQSEAVGHAVRALYLYAAMADLARIDGDPGLRAACERLWVDVTTRHMYLTGGVGSSAANEGFTDDYDLPNESAYAETCATVALVFWAERMLQLTCDGRYADVMERALYNGVLSGVSADGLRFFYANPLASLGGAHRADWFGCACCPPNVARLLASLGRYVYAVAPAGGAGGAGGTAGARTPAVCDLAGSARSGVGAEAGAEAGAETGAEARAEAGAEAGAGVGAERGTAGAADAGGAPEVAVHLYAEGSVRLRLGDADVVLRQQTDYPWDGAVAVTVQATQPVAFALRLRLPGWCHQPSLSVNGEAVDVAACALRGYARLERVWRDGDVVRLHLPLPVERVHAHPAVSADAGRVALQRGPLVYAFEAVDNPSAPVAWTRLPAGAAFEPCAQADGTVVLAGVGTTVDEKAFGEDTGARAGAGPRARARAAAGAGPETEALTLGATLYRLGAPNLRSFPVRAVPYFAWDNRGPGEMRVWMLESGV